MSAPGYQISRDPTAVIGTRTAAWIVDLLLYLVLIVGVLGPTPLSPLAEYSEVPDGMSMDTACDRVRDVEDVGSCFVIGDRVYFTDSSDAAIQIIGWLAYVGLIYVVWQGITGLTPGKLLFGLRTVGEDGKAPGMLRAFIRSVLWIIDGFPWCIPGLVGFITGLTSSGHRRVGDMAAKTFVVAKGDMGQPVVVPGLTGSTYGTPTVYGAQPGYGAQMPSSAPWGVPPGGPGAPGAPGAPAAPGAPGAPAWGTPPAAPPPPGSPYPPADARPAPPTAPYGTPATSPAPGATPSGGYPAAEAPAPPAEPTAPTAPAPSPSPDAGAFGESGDPAEADLPSSETESSVTGDAPSGRADEAKDEAAEATAPESTESTEAAAPESTEAPEAAPTEAPPTAPAAAPGGTAATTEQGYSPQWDAARGAYIQWDPNRSRWLQWDDAAKEWKPI